MTCRDREQTIEERIDEVLTRYRESPNLLFLLRTYLGAAVDVYAQICGLPEKFGLDTAVGDQLTILGKRLGFPRCHCVCTAQPVFGFACEGVIPDQPLAGFCEANSTWKGCGEFSTGDICLNDDELYRRFLKSRAYQASGLLGRADLEAAIRELFGPTGVLLHAGNGRIVVAPGRALTNDELDVIQLYPRVLPLAPGIEVRFHFESTYVFGFGDGWGGFCDPLFAEELKLGTENEDDIVTGDNDFIITGPITRPSNWMCQIDVRPYSC